MLKTPLTNFLTSGWTPTQTPSTHGPGPQPDSEMEAEAEPLNGPQTAPLTRGERDTIKGWKLKREGTRKMTAPRQKLGLHPNTPTRPPKPEGRANNPGQREFQDQENNEAKRGPEAGRVLRANPPPPFFPPQAKT